MIQEQVVILYLPSFKILQLLMWWETPNHRITGMTVQHGDGNGEHVQEDIFLKSHQSTIEGKFEIREDEISFN